MALSHDEQLAMFVSLLCLLGFGRALGELARRLHQPAVLGEILAGVLLGRTVLGRAWPAAWKFLFDPESLNATAVIGIGTLAVTLFMLVAGIEMSLRAVWKRGPQSVIVSVGGILIPFCIGFITAYFAFSRFDPPKGVDRKHFAFLIGVAMSITALPVVAKTLRDLHLYRTDMGVTVMSAATIDDLLGWALFAVVLSISSTDHSGPGLVVSLTLAPVFVFGMLTIGRWLFHRILPWLQAYLSWPGGVLGFIGTTSLASSSFSLYIGLHSTLGAFMTGAALGDSMHLRDKTRETLDQFVSFLFVPIYFAGIAVNIDFIGKFDAFIVFVMFLIACVGKLVGAYVGARIARLSNRESVALAVCMNARGAVEIILANIALDNDLITEKVFVGLVVMAITTSMIPGPLLGYILGRKRAISFTAFIPPTGFVSSLRAQTPLEAVRELCSTLDSGDHAGNIMAQEELEPTGRDSGVAIPHGEVRGLSTPRVAVGLSRDGIDFQAPSGMPSKVIILVLMPCGDIDAQHDLLDDITKMLGNSELVNELQNTRTLTELFALMQIRRAELTY